MTTPISTYRLQIRSGLTLGDAAGLVDYLRDLGVSTVYCSPLLTATPGSDHGYDVVDPTTIDPERGGEDGWRQLVEAAERAGLSIVVDIVPNHLGVEQPADNPSWWSVLRHGPESEYASWYDIDWSRPITMPVLGSADDLATVELVAVGDAAGTDDFELRYYDHRFPVAPGTATTGDDPAEVHERQHYRLIDWRLANTELSYRRFFAVNGLAGLRIEDPDVFAATHERVLRWVHEDGIAGLRIDHPDGLVDPAGYLDRLETAAPDTWIVVEKILEPGETLPTHWPVAGTTGYDAMAELTEVLIDPSAESAVTATYRELTGDGADVDEHVAVAKRMVMETLFGAELGRLRRLVPQVCADHGDDRVDEALRSLAVAFHVYRSYLPDGVADLDEALVAVRSGHPELVDVLDALDGPLHDHHHEFALRFQQLTGPAMAKGLEDTAWYRYSRFVALNEVGGAPGRFGRSLADFHADWKARAAEQPSSMLALSTHDTKRGEDVRARLACLSEIPEAFAQYAANYADEASRIPGLADRPFVHFVAQTFAGVGLIERERMHAYVEKAMREAATSTTWNDPDETFETAVHTLVDTTYDDPSLRGVVEKLLTVIKQPGWSNALTQKLAQLTGPGVPDVYQGTELWEDSLVDPDNRRPVDFEARRRMLASLDGAPAVGADGAAKLWVTTTALRLRRDHPEWFTDYRPVLADGPAADHLLGFDRGGAITLATRLPITLAGREDGWGETTITLAAPMVDELSGAEHQGTVRLVDVFSRLPVALLRPA